MRKQRISDRKHSFETKMIANFLLVILVIGILTTVIYHYAVQLARQSTYEKMSSQTSYYMEQLDGELVHIRQLQVDLFSDRKLAFIIGLDTSMNDYERRDAILSVKERILSITGISSLVERGTLYLSLSERKITESGVRIMTEEDREEMAAYLSFADKSIHYGEDGFFVAETGSLNSKPSGHSNHVFVLQFSEEELRKQLSNLNTTEGSGIFLYHSGSSTLIDCSDGNTVGEVILNKLARDEEGNYLATQRIKADGMNYLVFVGGESYLGLFVQYIKEDAIMEPINRFRTLSYLLLLAMVIVSVGFGVYARRLIHEPIAIMVEAFKRVQEGNWKEHIEQKRRDEFDYLYQSFNTMEDEMVRLVEEVYISNNLLQRAQLKQMQAQIAPHFLYNSFFALSRMVKGGKNKEAEELSKHLGSYFQYLTRNESDYLSLKQEAAHAREYGMIQGTRFLNRIKVDFEEIPQKFCDISVPRLILQPLLENAFEHGLKNKIKDGQLWVHFQESPAEYRVLVEDNGDEVTDVQLARMENFLGEEESEEITGIVNIHRRLQIYYHSQAGLRIGRSELGGICITVFIKKEAAVDES